MQEKDNSGLDIVHIFHVNRYNGTSIIHSNLHSVFFSGKDQFQYILEKNDYFSLESYQDSADNTNLNLILEKPIGMLYYS